MTGYDQQDIQNVSKGDNKMYIVLYVCIFYRCYILLLCPFYLFCNKYVIYLLEGDGKV